VSDQLSDEYPLVSIKIKVIVKKNKIIAAALYNDLNNPTSSECRTFNQINEIEKNKINL
jgi:hypothetical protein